MATLTIDPSNGSPATYSFAITGTATAAVTSDFTRTTLSSTFNYPYTLIYGPDNYLWLTERVGKKVNRVHKTTGVVDELLNISSLVYLSGGQDGLLGMALHPNLGKELEKIMYILLIPILPLEKLAGPTLQIQLTHKNNKCC